MLRKKLHKKKLKNEKKYPKNNNMATEKKFFETIRSGQVVLIINDKRLNALGVKKLLLPNAEKTELGTGKGAEIKACELQIKRNKKTQECFLVIGKSPKIYHKGKFSTIEYEGYIYPVPNFDTAQAAFDLLEKRIDELGGNLI